MFEKFPKMECNFTDNADETNHPLRYVESLPKAAVIARIVYDTNQVALIYGHLNVIRVRPTKYYDY